MDHPWLSLLGLVGLLVSGLAWGRGRLMGGAGGRHGNRKRSATTGSFFHLDGKEGLLNGGGYGKAD